MEDPGTKFAGKEYSKGDSRYAGRDSAVVTVEGITAAVEGPASLLAVSLMMGKSYKAVTGRSTKNHLLAFAFLGIDILAIWAGKIDIQDGDRVTAKLRYAIATRKPYCYTLQLAISLGQLYGDLVYFITSYLEGDNFATSPFYYWAYYVGANFSWIVIPTIIAVRSWKKISTAFEAPKKQKSQ
ncbi:hypothetical protein ACLOJK_023787 [Asimina triloba]